MFEVSRNDSKLKKKKKRRVFVENVSILKLTSNVTLIDLIPSYNDRLKSIKAYWQGKSTLK